MQRTSLQPIKHIDTSDFSEISSFSSPQISSWKCEWSGILVEQRCLCPGIVQVPALSEHFLGLHLQQQIPIEFTQQQEGVTRRAQYGHLPLAVLHDANIEGVVQELRA
jgi:hypothetical protein